jgi:hypothetical protein
VTSTCPWCNAPRETGPTCGRCGANYAKAALIKTQGRAIVAAVPVPASPVAASVTIESPLEDTKPARVEDPVLEWKFCVGAIPIALLLALAFHAFAPSLQRIVLGMPIHELGHAVTAWLCGYTAIPTLWKTLVPETRGFIAPLALLGAIAYMMYRAHLKENVALLVLGGALVLLQAIGTLAVTVQTTQMLITFGGDGAGMILGSVLMATFFFGKDTQLYKGSLRWGFLVIGSAAFVDMSATWWAARSDFGAVPFGEQEGVGLSDATKLVDNFGWTTEAMIRRYVGVSVSCLLGLTLVYAWGVRQARTKAKAANPS